MTVPRVQELHRHENRRNQELLHIRTCGIDEMAKEFSRLVRSHDVTLTDPRRDFVSELRYARLTRSALSRATVRASMDVRAFPARGVCLVFGALDQPLDLRIGTRRTLVPAGSIELVPPDVPFELYIPAGVSSSIMFEIELGLLESIIAEELHCDVRRPLRFCDDGSPHGASERSFMELLGFIHSSLMHNTPHFRNRHFVARLEALAASALLHTRANNYTSQLQAIADLDPPRFVRRAEDFIQAHAGEQLTLGRIAAAAAVSSRTLVRGFHRYRDSSPMAYLSKVRLNRAHAELLAGNPQDLSVTVVATKWGFSNLGRFAALYRRTFGENPVATLRRQA